MGSGAGGAGTTSGAGGSICAGVSAPTLPSAAPSTWPEGTARTPFSAAVSAAWAGEAASSIPATEPVAQTQAAAMSAVMDADILSLERMANPPLNAAMKATIRL